MTAMTVIRIKMANTAACVIAKGGSVERFKQNHSASLWLRFGLICKRWPSNGVARNFHTRKEPCYVPRV